MRAGLFGGTFNPIHNGHLMVVRRVLERHTLDRLFVIPCSIPPHKHPGYLAPAADRVEMIRLALPVDPRLSLSEIELQREGPSYTIDTVKTFKDRIVPGAELFLIMGQDSFFDIHTWKSCRQLLGSVHPVVVTRTMDDEAQKASQSIRMTAYIHNYLSPEYQLVDGKDQWQTPGGRAIHLLATEPVEASSTVVRQWVREAKPISSLVPPAVGAYIETKGLYR